MISLEYRNGAEPLACILENARARHHLRANEQASQNFTSWNQLDGWLLQVDGLRLAS
jgi:hypothetical protein